MTRQRSSGRYGPGEYSGDDRYWRDGRTGILYHVHAVETEECEVQGADHGARWREGTLSRLVRAPAIAGCRFDAVTDGTAQVAGSVRFARHARHGVGHLDDLGPGTAGSQATDMSQSPARAGDRQRAAAALARLDSILQARGWKPRREAGAHWYSRRYRRPVILWDQPVDAAELPHLMHERENLRHYPERDRLAQVPPLGRSVSQRGREDRPGRGGEAKRSAVAAGGVPDQHVLRRSGA